MIASETYVFKVVDQNDVTVSIVTVVHSTISETVSLYVAMVLTYVAIDESQV